MIYIQMNLLGHLSVNKELFYGMKCNKIHKNICKNILDIIHIILKIYCFLFI